MRSGGEAVEVDAPLALDDHVRLLRGAAVDRVGQVVERAVGVVDRDDAGALDDLGFVEVLEGEVGPGAVHIDRFVEGLEEGGLARAGVEDARLDVVQSLGDAREVGDEAPMAGGDLRGLLETTGHGVLAGEVGGGGVEVAALAPLDEDVVDGLAARCGLGEAHVDGHRVSADAADGARLRLAVAAAGHDPRHVGHAAAELERIHAGLHVGVEGRVAHPPLAAAGRDGDTYLAAPVDRDGGKVVAGVVLEDGAGGEGRLDVVAGLAAAGVVEGDQDEALVAVGVVVRIEVVITLVGEEVILRPASPFLAAAELVVDVDEVRDGAGLEAVDRVAEGVVVAFLHPGVLAGGAADLGLAEVVAREIHDRHAHARENVSVGQFELGRRTFVVAVREHDAFGRIEPGEAGERGEVPVVEGVLHHPLLAREIEIAGLDAQATVSRVAPVIHLADAADEKLGIDQRIVTTDVVGIHVVERVGVAQPAPFVEIFLDVVDEALVAQGLGLIGEPEEVLVNMLGRIEAHAVVVHGVAEPVDPADDKLARVLRGERSRGVVGILVAVARMADKRSGIGGEPLRGETAHLEPVVELQHDVHQADEFLVKRAAGAVVRIPLEHPRRTPVAAGL